MTDTPDEMRRRPASRFKAPANAAGPTAAAIEAIEPKAAGSGAGLRDDWQPDRASPVPLFLQIRRRLVAMIAAWPDPDMRFLTDEALARQFAVTKATVRQALSDLVDAGLLVRRRGSGTFIVRDRHVERLRPALDIDRQYADRGAGVTTRIEAFGERPATRSEADALGIAHGSEVVAIRRVRALAHVPIAVDDRVLSVALAARAGFTATTVEGSIVDLLRGAVELGRAAWELSAREAGPVDAALLDVSREAPVLVRTLVYRDASGASVLIGETRHRSDLVRCGFEMDLSDGGEAGALLRLRTGDPEDAPLLEPVRPSA